MVVQKIYFSQAGGRPPRHRSPGLHAPMSAPDRETAWEVEVFVLQAASREALVERARSLQAFLTDNGAVNLKDLAYTINHVAADEPSQHEHTLGLVAGSVEDLTARLDFAIKKLTDPSQTQVRNVMGAYYHSEPLLREGKMAMLFPGEGAQYQGMLAGLYDEFEFIREMLDTSMAFGEANGQRPDWMLRFFRDASQHSEEELELCKRELLTVHNGMNSVLFADWMMSTFLLDLGLQPAAMAGHSGGELGALFAAGCITGGDNDISRLVDTTASLSAEAEGAGSLLALGASREKTTALLEETKRRRTGDFEAYLAMDNCPHQTVVVGTFDDVREVEEEATAAGIICERLPIGRLYHTHLFEAHMPPLRESFATVGFGTPHTTVYACSTGEPFPQDGAQIRKTAIEQWRSPVEFTKLVQNMHDDGIRVFVEAGPRGNLSAFVADTLRGKSYVAIPADLQRKSSIYQLMHLLAQLAAHGASLNLSKLYAHRNPQRVAWEADPAPAASVDPTPPRSNAAEPAAAAPAASVPAESHSTNGQVAPSADGSAAVMHNHLQVMEQFLDIQQNVMGQYLASRKQGVAGRSAGRRRRVRRGASASHSPQFAAAPVSSEATQPSAIDPFTRPMMGDIIEHQPGELLIMRKVLPLEEHNYAAHHTVGGRSISRIDPGQHGLPVLPMTFTLELMLEAAAALLPGLTPLGATNIQLLRWLATVENDPTTIEVTARVLAAPPENQAMAASHAVLVQVRDLGSKSKPAGEKKWMAGVGTVLLAAERPEAPAAEPFELEGSRDLRVDIPEVYNNLFHGELLQGVESLDRIGDFGIESGIQVLPREDVFASLDDPQFISDPVLLDVGMHPAVAWHLEQPDQSGRILLPYELQNFELYGAMPPVGQRMTARIRIVEINTRSFTHVCEWVTEDNRLWARINGVKLWRFYLPFNDVNFHGPKDIYFLCDPWDTDLATPPPADSATGAVCMRLKELDDLKQANLQSVAARVTFGPGEIAEFNALEMSAEEKAAFLFERVAAKDAIRMFRRRREKLRDFMADVEIYTAAGGRLQASPRGEQRSPGYPAVAVSSDAGIITAIAAEADYAGISIHKCSNKDEASAGPFQFQPHLLEACNCGEAEAHARLSCAVEAVSNALTGSDLRAGELHVARVQRDEAGTMTVLVKVPADFEPETAAINGQTVAVTTSRDGDFVIATTFCVAVKEPTLK